MNGQLLSVVPSVHHEAVHETLHNRTLDLPESLPLVASSSVRDEDRALPDRDHILECGVLHVDILDRPLVEETDFVRVLQLHGSVGVWWWCAGGKDRFTG